MADLPAYRVPMPDEGHEAIRGPLAQAVDDLSETVALMAENQAGVQDSYFLTDVLFDLIAQIAADVAAISATTPGI